MKRYYFRLELQPEQVMAYYQGYVTAVQVMTDQGLRLQLDMVHFRRFFTHAGVSANFVLTTTVSGKFIRLDKIN